MQPSLLLSSCLIRVGLRLCRALSHTSWYLTPSSIITESIKSASMEELCRRCLFSGDKDTGVFLPQARNKKCEMWFVMKFRTTLNLPGFRFHYPHSRRVWQSKKFCQLTTHNTKNSGSFQHAARWEVLASVKLLLRFLQALNSHRVLLLDHETVEQLHIPQQKLIDSFQLCK